MKQLLVSAAATAGLVVGLAGPGVAGAGPSYAVATLAPALRENAHAVIRTEEQTLVVKSPSRTIETIHRAVTILDETGADWATQLVYYDQLNTVSYLKGTVYTAAGQAIRQLRPADIKDYSLSDGISLANDGRGRFADLRQPTYPYTVEFEYQVVSNNSLFYASWRPQASEQLAVEQASFRVITPTELPLRYQERHLPAGVELLHTTEASNHTYFWQVQNLPAVEEETDAPPVAERTPAVLTAPTAFEVQGHKGMLTSWQTLGQWTYDLNAGRDELPPAVKSQITALVQGETDERARIRKVYEFLQSNTRYISIQLGLGGWQTFPASSVATTGYGDCKALTNYCKSLLQAAGITSYCALVRADEPDIRTEFPSSQFNHVVLCVPLAKAAKPDTVWLECTSQTAAFNYMGSFTGNRHALLLTPTGGQLVRTPRYGAAENRRDRRAEVFLDAQGNATASIRTRRTGLEQDYYNALLHGLGPADQKEKIGRSLPLANFTIAKFNLAQAPAPTVPTIIETLGLTLPNLAPPNGKRLFITPNLLSRWSALPGPVGERQSDIWLDNAFTYSDTVRIHVPAGMKAESLPAPVKLTTAFGSYTSQLQTLPDGTLQYVRQLCIPEAHFSRTSYGAYVEFRRKISVADKAQVVFIKTES